MRGSFLLLLPAVAFVACSNGEPAAARRDAKPVVYVVNYPLQYFAERIGGADVEVRFPAPAGDPAFWEPDAATVAAYQQADLVLLNGATYAKWTAHASLPLSRCVDTSAAFRDRYLEEKGGVSHSHGPSGEHEHGGIAFTTWLDLSQAAKQARAVRDALARLLPGRAAALDGRFAALRADLLEVDARFAAAVPDVPLVASHPVYQYWARRYEARLESVHWEPDAVPDPAGWQQLTDILKRHPARWMIWEGEPLAETVEKLDGLGLSSVVVDPCGNRPETGDFLAVMRANAERLERLSQ